MNDRQSKQVSRRRFLQGASATLAATSLPSMTAAETQVPAIKLPAPAPKQVGFALVGLGSLAIIS